MQLAFQVPAAGACDVRTETPFCTMRKKLVRTGVPFAKRSAKLRKVVEQAHRKYAGVFKRLAE